MRDTRTYLSVHEDYIEEKGPESHVIVRLYLLLPSLCTYSDNGLTAITDIATIDYELDLISPWLPCQRKNKTPAEEKRKHAT